MKSLKIILSACVITAAFACANVNGQAPQKVKDAFEKKFPNAKSVKWDKENATEWEAEFKLNKVEYSANFSEDGTWMETEQEVKEADLPKNIKDAFLAEFKGYDIEEIGLSETSNSKVYEFDIEKGETEMEVAIDLTGKVVKKEDGDKEDKD